MIVKIDHMVITTDNMAACSAFYEALGFHVREASGCWEMFAGDFKINVHLKGKEREPKARHVQTGSADLCFELDEDLAVFSDKLQKNGISVELGNVPRSGTRGAMRSLYVRDPDGNLLEFCRYQKEH